MKEPGADDYDEEIDEPTAQEIARRYVEEHGRRDEDGE